MALILDGINQRLWLGSAAATTQPITISCWFYPTEAPSTAVAPLMAITEHINDMYWLWPTNQNGQNELRGMIYDVGQTWATASTYYTLNAWNHACVVFANSTSRSIYLNGGSKVTNTAGPYFPSGMTRTHVGAYSATSPTYKGRICQMTIHYAALTDSEVAQLAGGILPTSIQNGSIAHYWPLVSDAVAVIGTDLVEINSPTYNNESQIKDPTIKLSGEGSIIVTSPNIDVQIEGEISGVGSFLTTRPVITNVNNLGQEMLKPWPEEWFPAPGTVANLGSHDPRYNQVRPYEVELVAPIPGVRDAVTPIPAFQNLYNGGTFMNTEAVFEDVWWEMAHLLPRILQDVGNVVSEQVIDMELHNASRRGPITITSVTNNLGNGISIAGIPTAPFSIKSHRSISGQITVERTGDLVIDASFTFHLSTGEDYTIYIQGSRVVLFPVRPEAPFKEHLMFDTQILERVDGTEQRRSLRRTPRTDFEFTIKGPQNRQITQFCLFDRQAKTIALPMWHEPSFPTDASIPAGSTVINVGSTANREFFVGGYAVILKDEFTYDAIEIVAMDATSLTAKSPIEYSYDQYAEVMPLALAYVAPKVSSTKQYSDAQTFKVRMTVDSSSNDISDASGWSVFNGKVLLDDPNMMDTRQGQRDTLEFKTYDKTTTASLISKYAIWDHNKHSSFKGFKTNTREDLWKLRQLLYSLRGRQVSFYLPTFMDDLNPNSDLIEASSSMQIQNLGYTNNVQERWPKNYLRIHLVDGSLIERTVVASAELNNEIEQLTVDTPWPYDVPVENIQRVEFLEKVRFDVDDVVIVHYNALGQTKCSVPIKEVFD